MSQKLDQLCADVCGLQEPLEALGKKALRKVVKCLAKALIQEQQLVADLKWELSGALGRAFRTVSEDDDDPSLPLPRLEIRSYERSSRYSLVYRHFSGALVEVPLTSAPSYYSGTCGAPKEECLLRHDVAHFGLPGVYRHKATVLPLAGAPLSSYKGVEHRREGSPELPVLRAPGVLK